jgi:hypothetical protein
MHITFTLRNQTCPTVQKTMLLYPSKNEVKYLGMRLDASTSKPKETSSTQKRNEYTGS